MNYYRLYVMSSLRRLMLVVGLLLIGVVSLFPTKSAEMRVRSTPSEENLVLGKLAFSRANALMAGTFTTVGSSNADGSGQTTLSDVYSYDPAWSPDGARIAFANRNPSGSNDTEIYVMNADGTNRVNLTNTTPIGERNPSWSVTGKIAYEREGQIWTMNADGSNQAVFSAITLPSPVSPAWSPDGTKIAFASLEEIWVINADGSGVRQVTANTTPDNDPAWSPDGSKIAFTRIVTTFNGPYGLGVINADGTNEIRLTTQTDGKPAWSDDNTKIAFVRSFPVFNQTPIGIYTMNPDGTNQQLIILNSLPGPTYSDPAWQPVRAVRRAPFDFDGDGRSDISVFRRSDTVWYWLGSQSGFNARQWGNTGDFLAPADYDGDLKTDVAIWREVGTDGVFYILNNSTGTFRIETFGLTGDILTVGDWDGDDKADLSVYRSGATAGAQSFFFYRGSFNNPNGNITYIPWGTEGDKPVSGDYDGDGSTDAAIFRPSNATWYVRKSSDGQLLVNAFGLAGDKLVPAHYDNDLKTDFAVYRDGVWYIQRSTDGFISFQYGLSTDTPAPADYDGDGRADAAVFRNGVWYVLRSQSGNTEITQFGGGDDKVVPAAYVR